MGVHEQKIRSMEKKKNKALIVSIVVLSSLTALLAAGTVLFALTSPVVTYKDTRRFPVGSTVTPADFVKEVKNGVLADPGDTLDSSEPGYTDYTLKLKNLLQLESEREVYIEFYLPDESVEQTPDPDTKNEKVPDVDSGSSPFGANGTLIDGTYQTENGNVIEVRGGIATIDEHVWVNKSYSLPKNYGVGGITPQTQAAYKALYDAAKADGLNLIITSGYRTWDKQNAMFENYVKTETFEKAIIHAARPGHSEHHTGEALDMVTLDPKKPTSQQTDNKVITAWLVENAHRFGFILRYPEGKTEQTGYMFEPWHYRYVGLPLAEILRNDGEWITVEEYYGIDSVYHGY